MVDGSKGWEMAGSDPVAVLTKDGVTAGGGSVAVLTKDGVTAGGGSVAVLTKDGVTAGGGSVAVLTKDGVTWGPVRTGDTMNVFPSETTVCDTGTIGISIPLSLVRCQPSPVCC